jgi:hypothetical protein
VGLRKAAHRLHLRMKRIRSLKQGAERRRAIARPSPRHGDLDDFGA